MRLALFIVWFSFLCSVGFAQVIGITHPEKLTDNTLSLKYENDALGNTDYYYTQGVQLQLTNPALAKNPINRILNFGKGDQTIYGIGIEHNGYTPTSILSDSILQEDRPFAAAVMLSCFAINNNPSARTRISTQLSLGLIGPGAGGEEIQAEIHRHTNNAIPKGWEHQIANDLLLNYYVRLDHNLIRLDRYLTLDANGGAAFGTYNNKLFAGAALRVGRMEETLFIRDTRRFYLHFQYQPQINLIGHDATMQGGVFNRKNAHIIASKNISRVTFKQELDFTLSYRHLQLSANFAWISKEFKTGKSHSWGGFQCAVHF